MTNYDNWKLREPEEYISEEERKFREKHDIPDYIEIEEVCDGNGNFIPELLVKVKADIARNMRENRERAKQLQEKIKQWEKGNN